MKFHIDVFKIEAQGHIVLDGPSAEEAKTKALQMAERQAVVLNDPEKKYHVAVVKAEPT